MTPSHFRWETATHPKRNHLPPLPPLPLSPLFFLHSYLPYSNLFLS
jgi:hypothetical protein